MRGSYHFYCLLLCTLLLTQILRAQTNENRLVDSLVHVADSLNTSISHPAVVNIPDSTGRLPIDTVHKMVQPIQNNVGSSYTISGMVRDKATGEGIPFATVFFPGSQIGTPADLEGKFSLSFDKLPSDSLRVTAIGYTTLNRRIRLSSDHHPTMLLEMDRELAALNEFVLHAGEDPAIILLKKIIAAKPKNNPDRISNYKYRVYNKLEVDIRNLTKKQFESLPVPMIKKFSFIYKNLDTSTEEQPFLPFYLTETLSDYYFRKSPKKTREFILANQLKGVENESVDQFLGSNYQNVNAYSNFIPVFDKSFISPISDNGAFYYKYRIKDTQMAYGHPIILVSFRPKRTGENCFYGDFWVVDSEYAIQRISMQVPKTANINYVSRISLYQEAAPVHDSLWFMIKDKFVSDFNLPYNPRLPGFIGRKTAYYSNIVTNSDSISHVLDNPDFHKDVIVSDSARMQQDGYWNTVRPDTLSKNEQAIYGMIDTLNALPVFQRFKSTVKFLFGGYLSLGCIDVGPYFNLYSTNRIEGSRFRLGLATNNKLWKDIRLSGFVAYGTNDQRFKYYGDAFWIIKRIPRSYLFSSYRHDIDRSNNYYDNQIGIDNIFGNLFRKQNIPFKYAFVDDARLEFYKSYYSGFSHMLTFQRRVFNPYDPLPRTGIFKDESGNDINDVTSSELGLRLRYAYKEQFLESHYFRQSLGSDWPIPELKVSMGIRNFLGGNYQYQKASLSVSDNVKIAPLGSIYYNVFVGKTFGTLPYPLLDVAPGNEFYYYNKYAFNMMNRFEFLSDQYAGFNFEHSIGGGIFNYIPLLRKAKLRQFWTAKGIIGSLSDENKALNMTPAYTFKTLEHNPYVEVGTGIENILELFRIDFIWRVTPQPLPSEDRSKYFGIFGSVKFKF